MFLRLKRLEKSFGNEKITKALKPISLKIEQGEHVFVIGETGSGKSTFLKCLAGQYEPSSGEILLEGVAVSGPAHNLIPGHEDIELVEQEFSLKKFNTVVQNLEMALSSDLLKKEKRQRIKEMIDLFGLGRMKNKLPTELSGGQQQRLALAVALIELPKLLLLDEPFAHFDPQLKSRIFEYLKLKISELKTTVITVTHDYRETLKHADKVLVLEKGKKVQFDKVEAIYYKPKNLYVAGLLGEFNLLENRQKKLFLRPENIKITNSKTNIKVLIEAIEFCGPYHEIVLRTSKNEQVMVFSDLSDGFKVGEEVFISDEESAIEVDDKENLKHD